MNVSVCVCVASLLSERRLKFVEIVLSSACTWQTKRIYKRNIAESDRIESDDILHSGQACNNRTHVDNMPSR